MAVPKHEVGDLPYLCTVYVLVLPYATSSIFELVNAVALYEKKDLMHLKKNDL